MKQALLFLILLAFVISCKPKLDVSQEQVIATLTEFGKKNSATSVLIKTNLGEIELKLYQETPLHRANFLRMIEANMYNQNNIYRIVKGVCIQGGPKTGTGVTYKIPAEFNAKLLHKKGALAMARYGENNPKKMSSATEFFIVTQGKFYDAEDLKNRSKFAKDLYLQYGGSAVYDNEYTVFGEVTKGIEVAEKIAKLEVINQEQPLNMPTFSIEILK